MIERLRIRMYRVGFGDSFLLSFGVGGDLRHVLIDCGSITEGEDQLSAVVKSLVEACTPAGGPPRLELVVATSRQRDHVAGFRHPLWNGVEVGEVWMPWTEDPDDPAARRLLGRQTGFAAALAKALAPADFDPDARPLADARPAAKAPLLGVALNALADAPAMATLHRGFAGAPARRFLPTTGAGPETHALPGLPGVRLHVLGPARDDAAVAHMTPPRTEASLARRAALAGDAGTGARAVDGAFRPAWRIDPKALRRHPASTFRAEDERAVKSHAEDPDGELAAALGRAVGATSLMLMFEVGDQWLLFPGDAQGAAWTAALREPASRRLLERTTVYKVSHHGSAGATPRALVDEVIAQPYTAFLSVRPVAAWPNVPSEPLLAAMSAKGATVVTSAAGAGLYVEWEADLGA